MAITEPRVLCAIVSSIVGVSLVACSDNGADRSAASEGGSRTSITSVPDCDRYPCVQDDPENGVTHKIGNVYLRIPNEFLARPVETINTTDLLGMRFCWPDMHRDLASCPPVTDSIRLHLQPGPSPNPDCMNRPRSGWQTSIRGMTGRLGSPIRRSMNIAFAARV